MKSSARFIYLLILIALLGVTLIAVLATSHQNTKVVLREHAEAAMVYSAGAIADNTLRYLSPAERAAELTEELLRHKALSLSALESLDMYFINQLKANAELASIYIAQPNGNFFFVKRQDETFLSKWITTEPARSVVYHTYDINLQVIEKTLHPEDEYDPRTRPWYQKVLESRTPIWTDPYIFFTSKRPGITAARPVLVDSLMTAVVGVDIEISGLSQFLATVPISKRGSGFIINREGLAIAFPGLETTISKDSETPTLPQIAMVANAPTKGLLQQFSTRELGQLTQQKFKEFILDDRSQYGMLSPFTLGDKVWLTGVYAPEEDFQGQINTQYQQYLMQIIGIWILVTLLAIPVVFEVTRPMVRIYEQATRDELTQLPNRSEFLRKAGQLVRQAQVKRQSVAVAMLDLDGFKSVNDIYGHQAGDEVLSVVGQRLASVVRSGDLVGRLGGDEFALLLTGVAESEATHLVERIRTSISQDPIYSEGETYVIGATAGVAINQWGENILESLARADQALLEAKTLGKNSTLVFSPQGMVAVNYMNARTT